MSVNQISHDYLWWNTPHNHRQHLDDSPNSKSQLFTHHFQTFNLNQPNDDVSDSKHDVNNNIDIDTNHQLQQQQKMQLEALFEKPLTPSDVGKLNRLVIPKQHAERHFPLNTSNGADSGGMLLSFEDEDGKFWRFRYSYWNSSQSYVLTKGWSRYVKEKRLDAGDVVIFQRHRTDADRLFIAWRRRHDSSQMDASTSVAACSTLVGGVDGGRSGGSLYPAHHHQAAYPAHQRQQTATDPEASAGLIHGGRTLSFNGSTSSRTLRLFGVNMEYQFESDQSEPVTPDGSSTSSSNAHQQQGVYQHYSHFNPQAYYAKVQQDGSHSQQRG